MRVSRSGSGSASNIPLVLLAIAVFAPVLLFGYVALRERTQITEEAARTAERTAWVIREHALKVLETHELVLGDLAQRIGGRSWNALVEDEDLQYAVDQTARRLRHVAAIALIDTEGRVRVSSEPLEFDTPVAHTDYFIAHSRGELRTYLSRTYVSPRGERYFSVSAPLYDAAGRFNGVVSIEASLGYFTEFWGQLAPDYRYVVPMVRSDGELLARYPASDTPERLDPAGPYMSAIASAPSGVYTAVSQIDDIERVNAYTRLGNWPLYVSFSVETSSILARWRGTLWRYALMGLIATAALLGLIAALLRGARVERAAAASWQDVAARLEREMRRRELAEESLSQAQKMETIGQITGGVAHDFNNLLQSVTLNLHLARTAGMEENKRNGYIRSALDALQRGARLTQQLLAFARRQPLAPQSTDVRRLIIGLLDMLQRTVGDRVVVETEESRDLWPAMIDRTQAEMALLNLGVNARDAMPDGGTLTLRASNVAVRASTPALPVAPGDYVCIAVTDTGSGMSEETMRRAFEPFYTTKDVGRGSGLGLSQVHGFAVQSGGAVTLGSRLGTGTTVTLYLPRAAERPVEALEPVVGGESHGAGETILLVDDEALVRKGIAAALTDCGYDVIEARNGEEALEVIHREPLIHLLVSDYAMPGMRGDELARIARATRPSMRLLIITGYADERDLPLAEWGEYILRKPFAPAELARRVYALLNAPGVGKLIQLRPVGRAPA